MPHYSFSPLIIPPLFIIATIFSCNYSAPYNKKAPAKLDRCHRTTHPGRSSSHSQITCLQGYRCNYIYYTSFLYLTQVFIIRTSCEISFLHSTTTKVLKNLPVTKRYSKQVFNCITCAVISILRPLTPSSLCTVVLLLIRR